MPLAEGVMCETMDLRRSVIVKVGSSDRLRVVKKRRRCLGEMARECGGGDSS
jgi:hypothetical protein